MLTYIFRLPKPTYFPGIAGNVLITLVFQARVLRRLHLLRAHDDAGAGAPGHLRLLPALLAPAPLALPPRLLHRRPAPPHLQGALHHRWGVGLDHPPPCFI